MVDFSISPYKSAIMAVERGKKMVNVRKAYSDLTFVDDFMFCKVLSENIGLCQQVLEIILGIKINHIDCIQKQLAIDERYNSRGIRLDVYAEDDNESIYDIEMQTTSQSDLPKRTRYYQGMIDLNLIGKGVPFRELKKSYVIFICSFDPYGKNLPIYTFENVCKEDSSIALNDDTMKVIVNATGKRDGLTKDMQAFLDFLQRGITSSNLTRALQNAVDTAKEHKEWEVEYMTMLMKIQEEREDAAIEQLIEAYRDLGQSDDDIVLKLVSKFHLTKEQAQKRVDEYTPVLV